MLTLKKYTAIEWINLSVNEITKRHIHDLIEKNFSGKAQNYSQHLLKVLRGAFTYALAMDYIKDNPTPIIKFKAKDKIRSVLTETQVKVLLEKAHEVDSEWYPIWSSAIYTGMRSGELYALTWDNVNLEQATIKVCASWNNKDGFKDTKSGDDRIVEISPMLSLILKDRYANRIDNFVLPRISKWDKGEQARELRNFLSAISLPKIRFHDLRATWATILLGNGIEAIKVMKMGGWKDMDTMMIYCRKAGIDIKGTMININLHNHYTERTDNLIVFAKTNN